MDFIAAARRIAPYVTTTPLVRSEWLSKACSGNAYLKLENQQETGSFKLRGAANKLLSLDAQSAHAGAVTASTGNHALAVATMGRKLGTPIDVFVSASIDPQRQERIERLGATVHKVAGDCLLAEQTARAYAEETRRAYISPYNDERVVEGQGTIGVEIRQQLTEMGVDHLDATFVAVGGGGLISGIGAALSPHYEETDIVGCWPHHSPVMFECMRAGKVVPVRERPTLSVATAGGLEAGSITLNLCRKYITQTSLVPETEILAALFLLYRHERILAEGAAGVALASYLQMAEHYPGKTLVVVVCGGNADRQLEQDVTGK